MSALCDADFFTAKMRSCILKNETETQIKRLITVNYNEKEYINLSRDLGFNHKPQDMPFSSASTSSPRLNLLKDVSFSAQASKEILIVDFPKALQKAKSGSLSRMDVAIPRQNSAPSSLKNKDIQTVEIEEPAMSSGSDSRYVAFSHR